MTTGESSWTLETLIWLPVGTLLIAALAVAGAWLIHSRDDVDGYDRPWVIGLGIGSFVLSTLVLACTAWGMYPYKAEYHQWRDVSGTVAKVDHRLIGTGDGMEDKFVVRFDESGQQYGCDDTRCAGVEVGDSLTLSCKRVWQYTGTDGYDCRFVSTEPR